MREKIRSKKLEGSKLKLRRCNTTPENRIYIIDALIPGELKTGLSKFERLTKEINEKIPEQWEYLENQIFHKKCSNKKDFLKIIDEIGAECNEATSPLIFLDGHGDKRRGYQLPSSEFINWQEFNSDFSRISFSACGNLTVVASFCFSMSAIEKVEMDSPPPIPFYYGYDELVYAGDIENNCRDLIVSLVRGEQPENALGELKLYSEYDHVLPEVLLMLGSVTASINIKNKDLILSKKNWKNLLHAHIGEMAGATAGASRVISEIFNTHAWVRPLVESRMYDTPRREYFIEDVLDFLKESNNVL